MTELTLKWEKFGLSRGLHEMLGAGELVDVTLACQGEFVQAHKTVLAACSPHFRALFKVNPCQHPIVIMQDVKLTHLQSMLDFMYQGEVTVNQDELPGFLRTAEALRVSGLAPRQQQREMGVSHIEAREQSPPSSPPPLRPISRSRRHSTETPDPAAPSSASQQAWLPPADVEGVQDMCQLLMPSDIKVESEELQELLVEPLQPFAENMEDVEDNILPEEQPRVSSVRGSHQGVAWFEAVASTSREGMEMSTSTPSGVSSRGTKNFPRELSTSSSNCAVPSPSNGTSQDNVRLQCEHDSRVDFGLPIYSRKTESSATEFHNVEHVEQNNREGPAGRRPTSSGASAINHHYRQQESGVNCQGMGWKYSLDSNTKFNYKHIDRRGGAKILPACNCSVNKNKGSDCSKLTPSDRKENFDLFWSLNIHKKKLFVKELVELKSIHNPKKKAYSTGRNYFLRKDNVKYQVCSKMFANTLGFNPRTIQRWTEEGSS